ncbi:MAG: ATP-binding protein [Chromatiaceae bacterium]
MTIPAPSRLPQTHPSPEIEAYPSWRAMTWFGLFRLVLAISLCLFLLVPSLEELTGDFDQTSWTITLVLAYLGLALLGLALTHWRLGKKATLIQTGVFIDILGMSTGVLVLDEARRIRLGNQATAELLGTQDPVGKPLAKVAPELATWLATTLDQPTPALAPGQPPNFTVRVGVGDIEVSHLGLSHAPQGALLLFLRDKRALLLEAQQIKLAALGRLTAGIAHNIRNPLSAVKHASQLLAESPDLGEEDQRLLNIIQRNSGRIDGIVESILQLSRGHPPEFQTLDLALWLKELHAELRESRQLPHERLQLDIATDTPPARVNVGHLHQILANLCDNAIKHARTAEQPARLCLSAGRLPATAGAFIEIRDDGDPIDPEIAREMFTPFFTTSASGTGLGLYIALELAANNGITLEYRVLPGGGNGFHLSFPPVT